MTAILFLLSVLSIQTIGAEDTITVCSVPGNGAFMLYNQTDDSSSPDGLTKMLPDNVMTPSQKFKPYQLGDVGLQSNPSQAITGFDAELLANIMTRAKITDYELQFYAYYATPVLHLRTGQCDVAFGQFSHTTYRQHCGNTSVSSSSVKDMSCAPLPSQDKQQDISAESLSKYACCGSVGTPMFPSSIALLVKVHQTETGIATFLFQPEVINIISLVAVAVVVAGHLVWICEVRLSITASVCFSFLILCFY